jgi:hypothetical protein
MAYRRSLQSEQQRRHRAVSELPAEKSGWGQPLPAGRARGIAIHESFGSVVGEAAEVSMQGGLPAALYGEITFAEGKAQQANFDTKRVRRLPRVCGGQFTA